MPEPHPPRAARPSVVMLAALTGLTALSIDMSLPAMPQRQRSFDRCEMGAVQLALSLFLAGFAAGQLVCGVVADRIGRRPVLLGFSRKDSAANRRWKAVSPAPAASASVRGSKSVRFLTRQDDVKEPGPGGFVHQQQSVDAYGSGSTGPPRSRASQLLDPYITTRASSKRTSFRGDFPVCCGG